MMDMDAVERFKAELNENKALGSQKRTRHFALKPDDAQGVAVAVATEIQKWGGMDDAWRDMLPEAREEFTAALANIIRSRVNRMSRGVK